MTSPVSFTEASAARLFLQCEEETHDLLKMFEKEIIWQENHLKLLQENTSRQHRELMAMQKLVTASNEPFTPSAAFQDRIASLEAQLEEFEHTIQQKIWLWPIGRAITFDERLAWADAPPPSSSASKCVVRKLPAHTLHELTATPKCSRLSFGSRDPGANRLLSLGSKDYGANGLRCESLSASIDLTKQPVTYEATLNSHESTDVSSLFEGGLLPVSKVV
eukprot:6213250-Pleurochrysis_carterae.AAC.2